MLLTEGKARLEHLQQLVDFVWLSMFPDDICPNVMLFGSHEYGLSTVTSDWDFFLPMYAIMLLQAKVFRAELRKELCDHHGVVWSSTRDQFELNTLTWKFKGHVQTLVTSCRRLLHQLSLTTHLSYRRRLWQIPEQAR